MKMKRESGQVLLLAVIVVGLVLINTLVIIGGSQTFFNNTHYSVQSDQALSLAEAGLDKALASLNATGGSYMGEPETSLGGGSFSVTVSSQNPATKMVEVTGYVPSKAQPLAKRTVKATIAKGVGVAFNYGVQVGDGGLEMGENATVNGSVYSNGNILMDNNSRITGDAYVAGGVVPQPDQESDCSLSDCTDYIFGKVVGGESRADVAQSFQPSTSITINKIALKLKKLGSQSPSDVTVRLLADDGGQPDKGMVLASGILYSNLATDQYAFIEVALASSPTLSADTTYWIVVDTSLNSSAYWSWSGDSLEGYTRGQAFWSDDWQDRRAVWTGPLTLDLNFRTYMGGVATFIQGGTGSTIGSQAHANTLTNLIVTQNAYYQAIQNVTAASYYPGSADPLARVMPVSEGNISAWKAAAQSAGVYTGDITTCQASLGSGKYVGNIILPNNCSATARDPIWITGTLTLGNGAVLRLDSTYGSSSGVIVVDGKVTFSNGSKSLGSGTAGSFLMVVSTYDSRTSGQNAIEVDNGAFGGVLFAGQGIIDVRNTSHIKEITGWKIKLDNGVVIDYDSGLSSAFFSSGPSGAYSLVKGTYQLK